MVGAVPPAAPKPAAASSETIDRATCLYETQWQVTEGVSSSGKDVFSSLPQKQLLLPQKSNILPMEFMWTSAGSPERPRLVNLSSEHFNYSSAS